MRALAALNPRNSVPAFPTSLIRPWNVLYRRHRGNRARLYGGAYMASVAIIGPWLLLWRLMVVTYGTVLWLMWVNLVASVWLVAAFWSYIGYAAYRLAQYTYVTYEGKHRS